MVKHPEQLVAKIGKAALGWMIEPKYGQLASAAEVQLGTGPLEELPTSSRTSRLQRSLARAATRSANPSARARATRRRSPPLSWRTLRSLMAAPAPTPDLTRTVFVIRSTAGAAASLPLAPVGGREALRSRLVPLLS